jgi:two-component system phosphate regulon response regulator PhoB
VDAVLSILVVDDEFDFAELLAELLMARGHRVATAINGMIGRRLLSNNDYDLVITDFMMPIIDGIELVEGMRTDDRLADVPVIMISAQRDLPPGVRERLVQATLQKPFSPETLYATIGQVTGASPRPARHDT